MSRPCYTASVNKVGESHKHISREGCLFDWNPTRILQKLTSTQRISITQLPHEAVAVNSLKNYAGQIFGANFLDPSVFIVNLHSRLVLKICLSFEVKLKTSLKPTGLTGLVLKFSFFGRLLKRVHLPNYNISPTKISLNKFKGFPCLSYIFWGPRLCEVAVIWPGIYIPNTRIPRFRFVFSR